MSAQAKRSRDDLADLQTAQKEAGELSAAKLETVERALSTQAKRSRGDLAELKTLQKGVLVAVLAAAIAVISFILTR